MPSTGRLLGVELGDIRWHRKLRGAIAPGSTPDVLKIPQGQANKLLRSIVRFVADIPAGSPPGVVWTQGSDELLVDTSTIAMACSSGLIRVRVRVDCDQLDEPAIITAPIAVGAPDRPSGLIMSTFTRVDGPPVVADTWSEAIAAFAWEALLELAARLCAAVGRDQKGRALIPADISATSGRLLITPMARHDITLGGVR